MTAPIAVALDAPNLATLETWARVSSPYVQVMKVGLEVFLRDGAAAVHTAREASGDRDIFLDLKLHDIPNTVAGAARSVAHLRPDFLTVHALGGAAMINAAASTLPDTKIVAVTILTSMSQADVESVGLSGSPAELATRLAQMAVHNGARAIVCSPHEVKAIRAAVGTDITLITPGVRPAGADVGDQQRVATPAQALADGADLLVIGRPITGAADPGAAAATIARSC